MAEEKGLWHAGRVYVSDVSIKKVASNRFLITAEGITPDGETHINMHPVMYFRAPEDWLIIVSALQSAIHSHIEAPWKRSIEMQLGSETKQITVQGTDKAITKDVPH
jgi:hypothetical protein